MRLLFAITVGSFCAGLWVALALMRHIRRGQLAKARQKTDPTHEFFEAGEYRTPRPLRLNQEILRQKPRRPLSEFTFASASTTTAAKAPAVNGKAIAGPEKAVLPAATRTVRKPPQSIRSSLPRRIDLLLNNEETGDMAEQYKSLLRGSGTQGPVIPSLPDRWRGISQT